MSRTGKCQIKSIDDPDIESIHLPIAYYSIYVKPDSPSNVRGTRIRHWVQNERSPKRDSSSSKRELVQGQSGYNSLAIHGSLSQIGTGSRETARADFHGRSGPRTGVPGTLYWVDETLGIAGWFSCLGG